MPHSTYHNINEYVEKLSKLASFCKELNNSNICLLRDFNAGPENSFGKIYSQFCQDNSFIMSDNMILPTNSFTFLNEPMVQRVGLTIVLPQAQHMKLLNQSKFSRNL